MIKTQRKIQFHNDCGACDEVRGVMLLHKSENTKFKKGYNKYDNPRHYKDYKPPTIIEAEVSE